MAKETQRKTTKKKTKMQKKTKKKKTKIKTKKKKNNNKIGRQRPTATHTMKVFRWTVDGNNFASKTMQFFCSPLFLRVPAPPNFNVVGYVWSSFEGAFRKKQFRKLEYCLNSTLKLGVWGQRLNVNMFSR